MEEIQLTKSQIRSDIANALAALSEKEIVEKTKAVEKRLFDFANFLEAKVALMYVNNNNEVATNDILKRTHAYNKIIVLPAYNTETHAMTLMKVDALIKWQVAQVLEVDSSGRTVVLLAETLQEGTAS